MADLILKQTSLSPSSSTSPSVSLPTAPTISAQTSSGSIPNNPSDSVDNMDSTPDPLSVPLVMNPPPSVVPTRPLEESISSHAQNGHFNKLHNRMSSESLSPAPASSYTGSPNHKHDGEEDDKPLHRSASTNGSNNASPSKPAPRIRRPEPTFITSRDYAPLPVESQLDPHSEAWNNNKRSELSRYKGKVR